MSRSRKKNPCSKDYSRSSTKQYKRFASKTVRRYNGEISDGKEYRKLFCSYNIHDYVARAWDVHSYWHKQLKRK
jgi:hypothetical protein